jgi:hypothetical protein
MAFVQGLDSIGYVKAIGLSLAEECAPEVALGTIHGLDFG